MICCVNLNCCTIFDTFISNANNCKKCRISIVSIIVVVSTGNCLHGVIYGYFLVNTAHITEIFMIFLR